MAKLKDVLQYVAYGVSLDIIEQERDRGFNWNNHLFPECDLITREVIEKHYPELLERELANGIHAEGIRKDRLVIPVKKRTYTWDNLYERADGAACGDPELKAKDNARFVLTEIIKELEGYDIDECEIPEEEIEYFLEKSDREYLFDKDGNLVEER